MPDNYDNTDLAWTYRGDYILSHDGDLMDTEDDPLRSVVQEILTRIKSSLKEWKPYPDIGATLSDFVGEPNNKLIAEQIKTRITASLILNELINPDDLTVKYLPVDTDKLMVRLSLEVLSTAKNRGSAILNITTIYSYSENNVYFID